MDQRGEKEPLGFGTGLERHVNLAALEGIESIIAEHPDFADLRQHLFSHLHTKYVNDYLAEIYEELKESQGAVNLAKLREKISSYVASGKLFDEDGKQFILKRCLEEKTHAPLIAELLNNKFSKKIKDGERYLDRATAAFRNLHGIMSSGDISGKMAALKEAAGKIYRCGFFNSAIRVLYDNKLMDNDRYAIIKDALDKKSQEIEVQKTSEKELAAKVKPLSIAAVVLGTLGLLVLLANNNITGNIIGVSSPKTNIYGILSAIILLLGGVYLFLRSGNVK
jgi:hypothetical protein